jgi:hypothetical protein
MTAAPAAAFLDRGRERDMLDRLLAEARAGRSAVLVLRGAAGIGKTALLRYAARQASGFRVVQVAGVEAEMELPFAGLHQLCASMLDRLDGLPEPQRDALRVALGLAAGTPPDRFVISLAALTTLSAVAEERPLLCLVDDAQWLDDASAQVLAFVARRVMAESVAILFAARSRWEHGSSTASRTSWSAGSTRTMPAPCSPGPSRGCSTLGSATGSSPRRAAIRSRCSSCRAA